MGQNRHYKTIMGLYGSQWVHVYLTGLEQIRRGKIGSTKWVPMGSCTLEWVREGSSG